ncbi:hypothetical protein Dimus_002729 [Dionaea muscipula]
MSNNDEPVAETNGASFLKVKQGLKDRYKGDDHQQRRKRSGAEVHPATQIDVWNGGLATFSGIVGGGFGSPTSRPSIR